MYSLLITAVYRALNRAQHHSLRPHSVSVQSDFQYIALFIKRVLLFFFCQLCLRRCLYSFSTKAQCCSEKYPVRPACSARKPTNTHTHTHTRYRPCQSFMSRISDEALATQRWTLLCMYNLFLLSLYEKVTVAVKRFIIHLVYSKFCLNDNPSVTPYVLSIPGWVLSWSGAIGNSTLRWWINRTQATWIQIH